MKIQLVVSRNRSSHPVTGNRSCEMIVKFDTGNTCHVFPDNFRYYCQPNGNMINRVKCPKIVSAMNEAVDGYRLFK